MKFRSFYSFYLLTILLLILGLLTKDSIFAIVPGWHTAIIGYWIFFIPAAVCSLLTALIYQYWYILGRPLPMTATLHFIITVVGLLFSLDVYKLIIRVLFSDTSETSAAYDLIYGDNIFLGPIILIASLVIFIVGLVRARKLQKDRTNAIR